MFAGVSELQQFVTNRSDTAMLLINCILNRPWPDQYWPWQSRIMIGTTFSDARFEEWLSFAEICAGFDAVLCFVSDPCSSKMARLTSARVSCLIPHRCCTYYRLSQPTPSTTNYERLRFPEQLLLNLSHTLKPTQASPLHPTRLELQLPVAGSRMY